MSAKIQRVTESSDGLQKARSFTNIALSLSSNFITPSGPSYYAPHPLSIRLLFFHGIAYLAASILMGCGNYNILLSPRK